jgi:hypothetical protein
VNDTDLNNIVDEIENLPFLKYLELKIIHWKKGMCELFVPGTDKIINNAGEIRLGLCSIISEACAYIAACTQADKERPPITYSGKVTMISSFPQGGIYVYSDALGTQEDHLIESKIVDELGNLIALSTNRYFTSM